MLGILKKRWFQVLGVIAFVAAFALIMKMMNRGPVVESPEIAANIAGKNITKFQLQVAINRRMIRMMSSKGSVSSADKESILLSVFKALMNDTLLEVYAKEEGVTITAADRMKKKQEILKALTSKPVAIDSAAATETINNQMNAEQKFAYLWSTQGFRTEEEFLQDLDKEILEQKLSEHLFPENSYSVTNQEISDYIPRIEMRQIFLTYDKNRPQNMEINFADRKIRERAQDIYNQLKNGADFAQMAMKWSQEIPFAKNGGYLGYISKRAVESDFWRVASSLRPGEISEPFETKFGIHILKCERVRDVEDPVYTNLRKVLKKYVVINKQKSDFTGWFFRRTRELQEKGKIILYNPVLKANQLRNMGKLDEAIEEYRKAIDTDKEGAPYYHIDISTIYARQRKYTEALKELRAATELAPTDPILFFMLGSAYMEVGEHNKALAEFQKASEMSKLNYELHAQLEKVYAELGLIELADKEHGLYLNAIDILSGGSKEQSPGSMFLTPEYKMPESPAASPKSVRGDGGGDVISAPEAPR
ncbi:MAG: peptidylprolyl isomerase [bacterium]